ncbi:MAG: sugar phosphate nucleotidyltransferase [Vicinamibacterales bacterium]
MSASAVQHALLLSAGLGTRLRPLTRVRAKPAIPVAGTPMARRIIAWLAGAGITDVVLNVHHLPETIAAAVGDGRDLRVRARYSWEQPNVLGSAGGIRQALDIIGQETFLVVNGDTLTDLDLAPLVAEHQSGQALITMAVVPNREPGRYSGLTLSSDGAVLGVEPRGSTAASYHFIGVQVANASAFAGIQAGRVVNSVGDLYDHLIRATPGCVRAHICNACFWDIGTVADYWSTSHAFARLEEAHPTTRPPSMGDGARLIDSIVWNDVVLGEGCVVDRCIVTDAVRVPLGTRYSNMILMRGDGQDIIAVPFSAEGA